MPRQRRTLLTALAGIVAALSIATLWSLRAATARATATGPAPAGAVATQPTRAAASRPTWRRGRGPAPIAPARVGPPGAGAPSALDDEEDRRMREEVLASWQASLDGHRASGVDPRFAAHARPAFEKDLRQLAGDRFGLASVDCRTTSCVASLTFPSFDQARELFPGLLAYRYSENCGVQIVLPEPADASAAYPASILFSCPGG